jgi:malate dehydrogenase (oxaloacetate-decarboxylating)(NADP+)
VASLAEVGGRKGITPDAARTLVRTSTTVIAALAVHRGEADAMICGLEGRYRSKLRHIRDIIGLAPGVNELAAMSLMITSRGIVFLADTHVQPDPIRRRHCRHGSAVRRPCGALRPHSPRWRWCRIPTLAISTRHRRPRCAPRWGWCATRAPLEIDGEMQADTALIAAVRQRKLPSDRR